MSRKEVQKCSKNRYDTAHNFQAKCESGGIGRRAGFRFQYRKM